LGQPVRIRILGAGWYGAHLASAFADEGHWVEVHETRDRIFSGASGNIPARLHLGFHYPRSRLTRAACQEHSEAFMARYGQLTAGVPVNVYAIAADRSFIDFDQYVSTLQREVQFVTIARPEEFGLRNVEGAVLTGERHILTERARAYFEDKLGDRIRLNMEPADLLDHPGWDMTIDCTFCAHEAAGVDRYEPCLVVLLEGPTDRAVTIMDGPFPSLYPWDEQRGLCSLSSALHTPLSKEIRTWWEAVAALQDATRVEIATRADAMIAQMAEFYPAISAYTPVDFRLSVRAMPLSGADMRLVDVVRLGDRLLRVRAGKIDAVLHAEKMIRGMMQ
jgi:hypothetical protein